MNKSPVLSDLEREAQQHEVARLNHLFEVSRRDIFKLFGAGIVIGI